MPFGVRLRVCSSWDQPVDRADNRGPGRVSLVELHCMLLACSAGRASISTCSGLRSFLPDSGYIDAERSQDVTVGSLGLRAGERFCWRYDFCSDWVIDVRVEAVVDVAQVRVVSGRRAGPPNGLAAGAASLSGNTRIRCVR